MNTHTLSLITLITLGCLGTSYAAPDHTHELILSPNGGRIVTVVEPHFEFFLQADRSVQITFLDDAGEVMPVAEQQIWLVGGDRSAPVIINFVEKGGLLVSESALPDIKNMPVVLQIKSTRDAKTAREKFYLNTSFCGSCSYQEYACVCGH